MAGALTGNLLGASFSGVLGDLVGWRGVLSILGCFILVMSLAVAWGFRHQLTLPGKPVDPKVIAANYRRILKQPECAPLLSRRLHRRPVHLRHAAVRRVVPAGPRRAAAVDRGPRDRRLCGRRTVLCRHRQAAGGAVRRQHLDGDRRGSHLLADRHHRLRPAMAGAVPQLRGDGLRLLPDPRRLSGLHLGDRAGCARDRGVAAGVLLQLRPVLRAAALRLRPDLRGQGADAAHGCGAVAVGRHPVCKALASQASDRSRPRATGA